MVKKQVRNETDKVKEMPGKNPDDKGAGNKGKSEQPGRKPETRYEGGKHTETSNRR